MHPSHASGQAPEPPAADAPADTPARAPCGGRVHVPHVARRLRDLVRGDGMRQLRTAVKHGDVKAVEKLLGKGLHPLATFADGRTPLQLAVERGQFGVFSALLDHAGFDVNARPGNQLEYWLERKQGKAVEVLLAHPRVDPNWRDENGDTLLHRAAREGRLGWVQALAWTEAPAGPDQEGAAASQQAAQKKRADPAILNDAGLSPLHLAARLDHRILLHLLEAGADGNLPDSQGRTPLHHAMAHAREEVLVETVTRLLQAGADPTARDNEGKTPLRILYERGGTAPSEALRRARAIARPPADEQAIAPALALPTELQNAVAAMLDPDSRDSFSLVNTSAHLSVRASRQPHLIIRSPGDLEDAARHYQGRIIRRIRIGGLPAPPFTTGDLKALERFPGLEEVSLRAHTWLTGEDIASLPRTLRRLDLGNCTHLTDEDLAHLPPGLEALSLERCSGITDRGIRHLPRTLKRLNLDGCAALTDECMAALPPEVEEIDFSNCQRIVGRRLDGIPRTVRTLSFRNCDDLSGTRLGALPDALRELDLGMCHSLADDAIATIPRGVRKLDLTACIQLTDACAAGFPPDLAELNLDLCHGLTDDAVGYFPRSLRKLSLHAWDKLTDAGIARLPPNLKEADFQGCCGLTSACIGQLPPALEAVSFELCLGIEEAALAAPRARGIRVRFETR
ncbi:hypothetical protein NCCP691_01260 [Noviherbaspirillum aridicola]|uniref:Ankyrin repeat protein n=1 Tax=Noviherbaspirillum aridicola TaxID=2849687 RepID=A0ABQ4PZ09_9BURK|nr:hypothetical protein NCCP691_01260 [Noviherbaspirillum aridicola]